MFSVLKTLLFQNQTLRQTIFKNTFWLFSGKVVGAILRALLVIFAARTLGAGEYGSFALGMSFVLIFQVLPDFGIGAVLTREVARDEKNRSRYLATAFAIEIVLSVLTLGAIFATNKLFIRDPVTLSLIPVLSFVVLLDVLREFLYAFIRAFQKMEWQAFTHVFTNLLVFGFGISALTVLPSAQNLAWAYLFGIGVGTFVVAGVTMALFAQRPAMLRASFDRTLVQPLLAAAWPIGLANFLYLILLYLDAVMLGWFLPREQVGFYSAAVKFDEFLIIFPQVIALAIFPVFSKLVQERDRLKEVLELALQLNIVLALPIVVGVLILAPEIVHVVFGSGYDASIPALRAIIISLLFTFPSLTLLNFLIALDRRREVLLYEGFLVAFNFVTNLIFIPQFGIVAAATNTAATNALGFLFITRIAKHHLAFTFLNRLPKPFLASTGMGIVVLAITTILNVHLLWAVLIGILVYIILLILLKEPLAENVHGLLQFIRRGGNSLE